MAWHGKPIELGQVTLVTIATCTIHDHALTQLGYQQLETHLKNEARVCTLIGRSLANEAIHSMMP